MRILHTASPQGLYYATLIATIMINRPWMPPLLLLGSGTVLLVKSAVGHLQTGKGPDANREDGEDDEENNESREDA